MSHEGVPGQLVANRYRLVSELGAGGFGRVWKARDETLRVDVAVKAVSLTRARSAEERAERVARAEREARHAAQLRTHPNVVAVHDVAVEDGVPWMVMELVSGHSLDEAIRTQGRLAARRVQQIAQAVLEALCAAHAVGIVHRDVKPANVLLADDGRILLTDFGIAVRDSDTKLTANGMLIGSMEYIAPERVEGGSDTPANDLFSLGVTLYHALQGISPFQRPTATGALRAVLAHDPAPVVQPGALAPLVMALLRKDPGGRPTAEEALALLRDGGAARDTLVEATPTQRDVQLDLTLERLVEAVPGVLCIGLGITASILARFEHVVFNAADREAGYTVNGGVLTVLVLIVWGLITVGSYILARAGVSWRIAASLAIFGGGIFSLVGIVNILSWAST
ncbi:serine/threonine-protein kinase [Streptomyces lydicus]